MFRLLPNSTIIAIIFFYALSRFFSTIVLYCYFVLNQYCTNFCPQDSITRVRTVQRIGVFILRTKPSELHLETVPLGLATWGFNV